MNKIIVNKKYLKNWLNEQLIEMKSAFEVKEVFPTRYSNEQYENGAASIIFVLQTKKNPHRSMKPWINCFFKMKELQEQYLNADYELYIEKHGSIFMTSWEISVRVKED